MTNVSPAITCVEPLSAMEYRYDSGRRRYMTRRCDPGSMAPLTAECEPDGTVTGRTMYTAFGEVAGATGNPAGRYGYAGAWGYQSPSGQLCGPVGEKFFCDPLAELGWLHVGERYYDPQAGRFVQRDPIGIRGGPNVYLYVINQPVRLIDPSGLESLDFWGRDTVVVDAIARGIVSVSDATGFQGGYFGGSWGRHFGKYVGAQAGAGVGWRLDTGFFCFGYLGAHIGICETGIGGSALGVMDFETGSVHGGVLLDGGSPGLHGIGGYAEGAFGGSGRSVPIGGGFNADGGVYFK